MDFMQFLDMILHVDKSLGIVIEQYGTLIYFILFAIVFCETGLVVLPFLPGDTLLFVAGAFCATGAMNPWLLVLLLVIAAVSGNTVNYWIGKAIGQKVFTHDYRWLDKAALRKTHLFYENHGGKTIVLARFVPIVRTFAPFVAGVGAMNYPRFLFYNVTGGIAWILIFVWAGYFFGNIPTVERNFELVIFAIIGLSVVPMVIEYWKERKRSRAQA